MTRPDSASAIVQADWTWTGERFEREVQLEIGSDGRWSRVGALGLPPTHRLTGRALLPGFVNAHSHAFQRGLRGQGERFPAGAGSFWTWREAMYQLVDGMDAATFGAVCLQAYREMLAAGITTVGEFHYFHHSAAGDDFAFDRAVIDAAREAGIRLVLLQAYYRTGGIGRELAGGQRRFRTDSVAQYWDRLEAAHEHMGPEGAVGAVAHSIRAASPEDIGQLYQGARSRGLVFHMHVEEQRQEIEEARQAYGCTPMAAILAATGAAEGFSAVHCTHTAPEDMARFLDLGGHVCLCPLTEGNLGDGHPELGATHVRGGRLALGTDSNARIDPFEEMRWLEYGQRLAGERRGALADAEGQLARPLLRAATAGGAACLGVAAGRLAPGCWADAVALDLTAPVLAGWQPETLGESLLSAGAAEVVAEVCVGGRWRAVRHGRLQDG